MLTSFFLESWRLVAFLFPEDEVVIMTSLHPQDFQLMCSQTLEIGDVGQAGQVF